MKLKRLKLNTAAISLRLLLFAGLLALAVICSALIAAVQQTAQAPSTLEYVIPAPPVGAQSGPELGYSVAVDGAYTVVGAPFDDLRGTDCGAVRIFNSTTGELVFVLPIPTRARAPTSAMRLQSRGRAWW